MAKLDGVPDESSRKALPSGTSLYWLATHLTAVEINLFQRILEGRPDDRLIPPRPPAPPDDVLEDAVVRYQLACTESRAVLDSFPDIGVEGRGRDRRTSERYSSPAARLTTLARFPSVVIA